MGSRLARLALALVIGVTEAISSIGCARGGGELDTGRGGADAPSIDARGADVLRSDVPPAIDVGRSDVAATDVGRVDAPGLLDAGRDARTTGDLDPALDVPPATNDACMDPGDLSECAGIAVCRFYSSTEGRCESCTACGNLFDPCSGGEDCDILFVCFMGQCTNFCTLGSFECGPPTDCIDIGHPTRGACRPGF